MRSAATRWRRRTRATLGYPGFRGLGLPAVDSPERNEPYIYHFPDGNASLARLLVRALIPGVAPGATMDDIVLAPFDYAQLDRDGAAVRLRLDSTCVHVRNVPDGVELGYMRDGTLHRVAARHAVLACFNMLIPYIMPEVPAAQQAALAQNVKAPLVYTNVLVRNWQPWVRLGVHEITAPMSIYSRVKLDYPVSLGGYRHARDPAEPMCLHMVYVPVRAGLRRAHAVQRSAARSSWRWSLPTSRRKIRDQLDRMLGPGGFSSARDIAAITVNRWSHGYAYTPSSLFDRDFGPTMEARAPADRTRGHRQLRRRLGCLCPCRHRSGRPRGARTAGLIAGLSVLLDGSCCGRPQHAKCHLKAAP